MASSGFNYSQDGKNWISYNEGLPQDLNTTPPNHTYYTHDVYAVDGNDQYIFAGTKEGIFRSEKSNLSWVNLYSIAGNKKVNALLCIDSNVFMSTENNIFRSTDNGSSWVLSHQFSSGNTISKLQNINDTIFASTLQDGIYSTSDLGVTWQSMNEGLNNLSAFSITKHKNTF